VEAPSRPTAPLWVYFGLLWLAGICLRCTVLAVPPVLPVIHRDLRLDETLVGALSSLPVLLLAAAAIPGSLLIARIGARRALALGLGVVALAGAARGLGPDVPILFAMTFLMGAGIAVSQPALPSLVRQWLPHQAGRATAVFSNGFLIGEIVAAALTSPLVLPLVGGSWPLVFVVWSVPVLLTMIALLLLTPHTPRGPGLTVRWWPDWRSALTWRLGFTFGCASVAYFGTNAFLPDYLKATHHPELITAALTSVNLCQLPTSLLAAAVPHYVVARRWPFLLSGALILVSAFGFRLEGWWVVAWAGVMGFASATGFVLCLALPPLLAGPEDVHRLSAAMFTITYACAFVASLVGGAVWDATGIPVTTFAPVALAGVAMILLVIGLDLSAARQRDGVPVADIESSALL
jgi:CP family cyanate transporter-like MFS transporter